MSTPPASVILLYHRVAEPASDPFELAVTPRQFEEHLDLLGELGRVVSLAELARCAATGDGAGGSFFAVTFDDGYADNLHAAKPLLVERGAPATVFVTTGAVGTEKFWWDELAELLLDTERLPEQIALELDGHEQSWQPAEAGRPHVFHAVWAELQPLDDRSRSRAMASLRAQVGAASSADGRAMTAAELEELCSEGLVDIGAHTKTHPVLSTLAPDRAREEIVGSKAWLEDVLGHAVPAFSYPFGGPEHYGRREVGFVREAGFEHACSAVSGIAQPGCDPLQLPRMIVGSWEAERLERALSDLLGITEQRI